MSEIEDVDSICLIIDTRDTEKVENTQNTRGQNFVRQEG